MLKIGVSRFITMNVFGNSQASDTKRIISDIQSSNKTILNDVKLQQKEIDTLKSNIINVHLIVQYCYTNNIQTSNKSLLNYENRMSELINSCVETSTVIGIYGQGVNQLKAEINRITGIYDANSLPNHRTYISELNSRLEIIESKKIKYHKLSIEYGDVEFEELCQLHLR